MASLTDEQLLRTYRMQQDRAAFHELVHRYERDLYNYLRRYLGDGTLAEDAFQLTFLQVHLKCDQFEEGRKFKPWLYAIATHQAIDAQRRGKRHRMVSLDQGSHSKSDEDQWSLHELLVSGESLPGSHLEATERREQVQRIIEQLPESQQVVVNLVYYQGMKYREAAEVLRIPVGTVKSRLHSAILKFDEAWKRNDGSNHHE